MNMSSAQVIKQLFLTVKLTEISLNNKLISDTKGKRARVNKALVMRFLNKLKISFAYILKSRREWEMLSKLYPL
ncbi:hypothetical protein CY0110_00060 [Crocosphaera chwakensis CCY0110]|uniref:Uncharacterized protein n=1 Tax=Crocosphaera chwakensis CCY0110 TaxID=391612 RepID=A3IN27_9CHRO|nr:hypothetical protein CY0110_00060 [Crocosphaera chwakensis CCY0110]